MKEEFQSELPDNAKVDPLCQMPQERLAKVTTLRETFAKLRLCDASAVRGMGESLIRHGQFTAVVAYEPAGSAGLDLEVVDGFKRLRAMRNLGWRELRICVLNTGPTAAKAAISILNSGHGLSGLEEAWLVRSLYREDALTQPQIGQLLARHKSWVSRRLLLAEGLDESVQADVRLGLLSARTAEALARLPRGNQRRVAEEVMKRGFTQHRTDSLVSEVMSHPASERDAALDDALRRAAEGAAHAAASGVRRQPERTPAQWLVADAASVTRLGARLQARLFETPLTALGEPEKQIVTDALIGLVPVLDSLRKAIERTTTKGQQHVSMDNAPRT